MRNSLRFLKREKSRITQRDETDFPGIISEDEQSSYLGPRYDTVGTKTESIKVFPNDARQSVGILSKPVIYERVAYH